MGRTNGRRVRITSSGRLAFAAGWAVFGVQSQALAQGSQRASASPAGPIAVHRDPASDAISLGRARLTKGDFPGALEAFDAALRTSIDVTVRRDRGVCHERLGHPFPAMDDYRAYLTALPDAPDSEDVRARLNQLETSNGLGGTGTGGSTTGGGAQANGTASTTASHEDPFAVEPSGVKGKYTNGDVGPGAGDRTRAGNYDQELAVNEKWDEAESSGLRRGSGLSFGVYGRGYGAAQNGITGYGVGATIRGALGKVSTVFGEVGYVTYRAGSDAATGEREGGLSLGLGYEVRIRLDQFATHSVIAALSVSYERVSDSNSGTVYNLVDPRGKLGYRFVLGPGFGIELAGEVAQPIVLPVSGIPSSNITTFGGTLALLVGF